MLILAFEKYGETILPILIQHHNKKRLKYLQCIEVHLMSLYHSKPCCLDFGSLNPLVRACALDYQTHPDPRSIGLVAQFPNLQWFQCYHAGLCKSVLLHPDWKSTSLASLAFVADAACIDAISKLSSLRHLEIHRSFLQDPGTELRLNNLDSITELVIGDFMELSLLPRNLRKLYIGSSFLPTGLEHLHQYPGLERICLHTSNLCYEEKYVYPTHQELQQIAAALPAPLTLTLVQSSSKLCFLSAEDLRVLRYLNESSALESLSVYRFAYKVDAKFLVDISITHERCVMKVLFVSSSNELSIDVMGPLLESPKFRQLTYEVSLLRGVTGLSPAQVSLLRQSLRARGIEFVHTKEQV